MNEKEMSTFERGFSVERLCRYSKAWRIDSSGLYIPSDLAIPKVVRTVPVAHSDDSLLHVPHAKPPSLFCSLPNSATAFSITSDVFAESSNSASISMRSVSFLAAWTHGVSSNKRFLRFSLRCNIDVSACCCILFFHKAIASAISELPSTIYFPARDEKICETIWVEVVAFWP